MTSVSRATTSSSVPCLARAQPEQSVGRLAEHADRGQRQLLVPQRHPRAELESRRPLRRTSSPIAAGLPAWIGPSSGFAVIMVRPVVAAWSSSPQKPLPTAPRDSHALRGRAYRAPAPGRRPELQQQLPVLGHVRAGDEVEIVPADARSDPVAGLAQPRRPDPQILPAHVAAERRNALDAELQRERGDVDHAELGSR